MKSEGRDSLSPDTTPSLEANMSEKIQRAKVWVLTHSGMIVAIAFVAIALASFAFAFDLGLAGRRPKP